MIEVVRIQDPNVLLYPAVQDLFREAWSHSPFAPRALDEHPEAFVDLLLNPNNMVLVGAEDGLLGATATIVLPHTPIMPLPVVGNTFNKGSRKLILAVYDTGLEMMRELGYTEFVSGNSTGKPDKTWLRGLGHGFSKSAIPVEHSYRFPLK